MGYRLRFGDFDFPITLLPTGASSNQKRAAQARRRASGSITQRGRRDETHLPIRGNLTASTPDALHALIAQVKAAAYSGKQPLWYGRDDRYYRDVQLETESVSWGGDGTAHGGWASMSLLFVAGDYPESYGATVTDAALTPTGGAVNLSGDAPSQPLWTITMGGAGTGALTLTNTATGETALLDPGASGWAAGEVVTLNRDGYTVTRNGVAAFGLLQFRIPHLAPGANAINLSLVSGATATVSTFSTRYQARFR